MPDTDTSSKVSLSVEDAIAIIQSLGALAGAANLVTPGVGALVTGALALVKDTIVPAIKNLRAHELSVLDQAVLAAESAVERARVGAPAAAVN